MHISSRMPEGTPSRCPICGHVALIMPSTFPTCDAPCPHCGSLMWFSTTPKPALLPRNVALEIPVTYAYENRLDGLDPWPTSATKPIEWPDPMWLVLGAVSTLMVAWNDGLVLTTGLWLAVMLLYGQVISPWLHYQASYGFLRDVKFYLGVMLGWSIVAGPMAAAALGPLIPYMTGVDFPSYVGGIIGLIIFPPFAAVEGVVIVGMVDLAVWLWSGKSLHSRLPNHGA
jgi:hypothetical protein